ncbi:RAN GTPase-activating protein 2 [Phytophthora pseudosyringae]|uniref:RAN GTPase-activating protein 2 n=1 Tax=Phytophthora pseudosyringae TaxID=221518 RepID=A0A8T1V448_9STRA|nr:RAN GTPase-activating protein 2 [Phytophthora pseudosyringae]
MAAQIADRSNAGMSFSSGESAPELSKLEATRLALAQEQKKRIDAAVARVTSKKEGGGGKRKGLSSPDAGHRSKKSKTVVDVANDQVDKKNSIARRMVDRFSAMPEPEHEEEAEHEPATRSVSTQQFVARSTTAASPSDSTLRETVEKVVVTTKTTTVEKVKVTEEKQESAVVSEEDEAALPAEKREKESKWDGPTTNYHVKQLGLDDKVDIYAPVAQQQEDVQRVRERAKYMPSGESINSLKTSSDSETDSDFALKASLSQESEESDAVSLPEVDASETQALAEEAQEFERQTAIQTAEIRRTWAKRVFVYTPLSIVAIIVLVFALLFAIDWSQETFQFCEIDAEGAERTIVGSEEIFSCASFVETQSLIKSTLRETAEKAQETLRSYFE